MILLDEPTAGMSRAETEQAVELIRVDLRREDAGDGRARHGRRVRPRRPDLGARLRRDHRHRRSPRASARTRPCRPRTSGPATMLEIDALHAYYGKSHILHGDSLAVGEGEIVSLLGTQRRRPLDDDQDDHGARSGRSGIDPLQGRAHRRPQAARDRPQRDWATCPRTARSSPISPCAKTCSSA